MYIWFVSIVVNSYSKQCRQVILETSQKKKKNVYYIKCFCVLAIGCIAIMSKQRTYTIILINNMSTIIFLNSLSFNNIDYIF